MDPANGDDGNGICFPYDVLISILRRVQCRRALAESRLVCRSWRAIVDGHSLLLPHYFPPNVFPGVFTNLHGSENESSFFAPTPSSTSKQQRRRRRGGRPEVFRRPLFRHEWASVLHHCNGLILLEASSPGYGGGRFVCNPATVRCGVLPRLSEEEQLWPCGRSMFLAFDPAVLRHYQVFFFPPKDYKIQRRQTGGDDAAPQGVISVQVFSSQTGRWASRDFSPGRCAPRDLYDKVSVPQDMFTERWMSAEYWRGSLYVHHHKDILMILRCGEAEGVYDMVRLPGEAYIYGDEYLSKYYLPRRSIVASYEGGVRYVAVNKSNFQLKVWTLSESTVDGQLVWMLAHEADLSPYGHILRNSHKPLWSYTKVTWEAVESNKATDSLFKPREKVYYGVSDETDVNDDDVDGDADLDEGIHEVDGLGDTISVADDGCSEGGDSREDEDDEVGSVEGSEYSWNSDEDNFIDQLDECDSSHLGPSEYCFCRIMGLHPHKDVLLLQLEGQFVAYHLITSRMQYLGWWAVKNCCQHAHSVKHTFPYRPCYLDVLPTSKMPHSIGF